MKIIVIKQACRRVMITPQKIEGPCELMVEMALTEGQAENLCRVLTTVLCKEKGEQDE